MKTYIIIIAICILIVQSCKKTDVEPIEYIKWIENPSNGMVHKKKLMDYSFNCFYQPKEYRALKLLDLDNEELNSRYNDLISKYDDIQYLSLRILANNYNGDFLRYNIADEIEYNKRIEYYSFLIQEDLKLIDGLDTLPCVISQFERTYGITPYITLNIGFEYPKPSLSSDKTLVYNDRILGTGPVYIKFHKKHFDKIPTLKVKL